MGKERLSSLIIVQATSDLHFLYIFLKVENNLQRFFIGMSIVVMVDFHCQRVTITSNRPSFLLNTLLDVFSGRVVYITPHKKWQTIFSLSPNRYVCSITATFFINSYFFP